MKFTNFMIVTVSAVLIYCTVQSTAIKCYHCHSHYNETCGDPFEHNGNESTILIDCDKLGGGKNYTYCRKTVQFATMRPDQETTRIIRTCGFLKEPKLEPREGDNPADLRCYRRTGTFAVELRYCACHEDGCNSGNWLSSGGILLMACAMLSIFNGRQR